MREKQEPKESLYNQEEKEETMAFRQRRYQGGGIPPGAGGRQLVLPEPGDLGQIIVRGATNFARRHKVISGSYILGIVVLLMFSSGAK